MLFHTDTYMTLIQEPLPEAKGVCYELLEVFLLGLLIWYDFCFIAFRQTSLIYYQQ